MNDELMKLNEEVLAAVDDMSDRTVRIETVLFKLCMHLGMNPRNGEQLAPRKESNGY